MVLVPWSWVNITVDTVQMYLADAGTENVDIAENITEAAIAATEHISAGWEMSVCCTVR